MDLKEKNKRNDVWMLGASFFTLEKTSEVMIVIVFLIAFSWIFYSPLSEAFAYAPWADTIHVTGPLFCEAGRQFSSRLQVPEFNWINFVPSPYNAHFSPFYPFYFLGLLDYCSGKAAVQSQDIVRVFHIAVLFINVFVLGRVIGFERTLSILAAALCVFSVDIYVLSLWPTIIASMSWIPLAIAGLLLVLYCGRYRLGSALLITSVTFMLFAGPGSNAIAPLVFMVLVFSLVRVIALARAGQHRDICIIVAVGLGAAAAVAALNLGSTGNLLTSLGEMIRWTRTGYVIGLGSLTDVRDVLIEQQPVASAYGILFPDAVSYAVGNIFVGPLIAALAVAGAFIGRHESIVVGWIIVVLLTIFLIFLDPVGIALFWGYVPGLSHTRHLSLLCTPFLLGTVFLAAAGLDSVLRRDGRSARLVFVVALGLATCVGALAVVVSGQPKIAAANWTILAISLATGVLILVAGRPRFFIVRAAVPAIIVPVSLVISLETHKIVFSPVATSQIASPTWAALTSAMERIKRSDSEPGRLVMDPSIKTDGFTNYDAGSIAAYVGLPSFQTNLSPNIFWKFMAESHRFPDYDFYALRSAKYVLAGKAIDDPRMESAFVDGPIHVYRLTHWRPWVNEFCLTGTMSPEAWSETKTEAGRLPDAPAALVAAVARTDAPLAQKGCDRAIVSAIETMPARNGLRWRDAGGPERLLIVNLPPYGAWQLRIGDRQLPLYNVDQTRMVAIVPAGLSGDALVTYRPTQPRLLLLASLISGCIVILVFATMPKLWNRKILHDAAG